MSYIVFKLCCLNSSFTIQYRLSSITEHDSYAMTYVPNSLSLVEEGDKGGYGLCNVQDNIKAELLRKLM